jgi:hypothetical protein
MCSNNLREGVFDAYAVDPSNPNTEGSLAEDHFAALFVPAVQGQDRPAESFKPTESLAPDYHFELMV